MGIGTWAGFQIHQATIVRHCNLQYFNHKADMEIQRDASLFRI